MVSLRTKRIYAAPSPEDGARILVDRLWPRGVSKEKARLDAWLRDLSPSDDLRKRFGHDPAGWDDFRAAYALELAEPAAGAALADLRAFMAKGPVTLLFAAKDEARNNAVALQMWLYERAA
ncbi:MAG: DUF488 family protein [Pseudomonadota bacterium]